MSTKPALMIIILTSLLTVNCTNNPALKYEMKFQMTGQETVDYQVYDLDKDGVDELITVSDHLNNPRISIFSSSLNSRFFAQININNTGRLYLRKSSENEQWLFGIVEVIDLQLVCREYSLEGELINEFRPSIQFQDDNGNGFWNGAIRDIRIFDYDGDRIEDIIILVMTSYDKTPRGWYVLSGVDGSEIIRFEHGMLLGDSMTEFYDIDNDGKKEIVFGTAAAGNGVEVNGFDDMHCYLSAMELDGSQIWLHNMGGENVVSNFGPVADYDHDGEYEFLVLINNRNARIDQDDQLLIVDIRTGEIERTYQSDESYKYQLLVADFDNDSDLEIYCFTSAGNIEVHDNNLKLVEIIETHLDPDLIVVGDLPDSVDGKRLILGTSQKNVVLLDEQFETVATAPNPFNNPYNTKIVTTYNKNTRERHFFIWQLISDSGVMMYELEIYKKALAIIHDYSIPLISAGWLALFILGFLYYRKRNEHRADKQKINFLLGDVSNGSNTLIINNNLNVINVGTGAIKLFGKTNIELEELPQLKAALSSLRNSDLVETDINNIEIGDGQVMRLHARKILAPNGNAQGYLVNLNEHSRDKAKLAEESVKTGQELMHKIKTLISVYSNDLDQLRQLKNDDSTKFDVVADEMQFITNEIASVAKDYLLLSNLDEREAENVDVNSLVNKVISLVHRPAEKIIQIDLKLDDNLPIINGDSLQLERLITNLIENSVKAIESEGVITIQTDYMRCLQANDKQEIAQFISITIVDDGPGIGDTRSQQLMYPGYSEFEEGSGLGLSICKRIVDLHRGEISISNVQGKGAMVEVRLPVKIGENPQD